MGQKLSLKQIELYKNVDEVLFYKWDPIGISDIGGPKDEYHSYLPRVFELALENNTPEPIANYLTVVSTENMGLSGAKQHDIAIAKLILDIKRKIGI